MSATYAFTSALMSEVDNIYLGVMATEPCWSDGNAAFWQKLVLPEEERRWFHDWDGGYRWFRSSNVVQLERYRSREEMARIRGSLLYR